MPTYEYKCSEGHVYTEVRGISEETKVTECPECGKPLNRIFSAPPITFKGSGFSKTHG